VKIKAPAAPYRSASPQGTPTSRLTVRDRRSPLVLTVAYRGGSEAWYELRTRGRIWRISGSVCLHDVMEMINDGVGGQVEEFPPLPVDPSPHRRP
jgi:hypothetical protein